jgi:DNA mismatch endonuclease, patch repair protein
MTDVFDKRKRSWVMSRVKGKNTKPEIFVRSLLHRLGYRFTVNGPKNRKLPGKPDIVLPKYETVVFVHGCFWHGHRGCKHYRIPKSRTEWWTEKIESNRRRDLRNLALLESRGWNVVVLWTCQFDTVAKRETLAETLSEQIEHPKDQTMPPLAAEAPMPYGKHRGMDK